MLAGIVQAPDESVLETLFYKQVKNCKAIQHDMNEYHGADEGTEKRTYSFLVSLSDITLTVRGWRQTETELPKAYQVPVVPPLLQSRARQASSQRGTVWHGTKGAVVKTTVLTSMKPQSHVTEVVSLARLEVAVLIVGDLPSQRGKARKLANFGSRVDVIEELIASFFTRVRLVSLDKPLLPGRQVATAKVKGSLARTRRRRDHVALVALRAQRAQSPQSPKDPGQLIQTITCRCLPRCIHACIRVSGILHPSAKSTLPIDSFQWITGRVSCESPGDLEANWKPSHQG